MNDRWDSSFRNMFKVGTPECAVFAGVVALVFALLALLIGVGRALLVTFAVAIGMFVGGVKDKKAFIQRTVNRLWPAQDATPSRSREEQQQEEQQ